MFRQKFLFLIQMHSPARLAWRMLNLIYLMSLYSNPTYRYPKQYCFRLRWKWCLPPGWRQHKINSSEIGEVTSGNYSVSSVRCGIVPEFRTCIQCNVAGNSKTVISCWTKFQYTGCSLTDIQCCTRNYRVNIYGITIPNIRNVTRFRVSSCIGCITITNGWPGNIRSPVTKIGSGIIRSCMRNLERKQ